MTSTDPEGTGNIGYPQTKEGTAGASTRKNQDLESCESDKLAASVSEAHRGNLHCGTESLPYSCKFGVWSSLRRRVQAGTTAFRVRSTLNEPPRSGVLAFIRALADKLNLVFELRSSRSLESPGLLSPVEPFAGIFNSEYSAGLPFPLLRLSPDHITSRDKRHKGRPRFHQHRGRNLALRLFSLHYVGRITQVCLKSGRRPFGGFQLGFNFAVRYRLVYGVGIA
jgi:hypothetical protein